MKSKSVCNTQETALIRDYQFSNKESLGICKKDWATVDGRKMNAKPFRKYLVFKLELVFQAFRFQKFRGVPITPHITRRFRTTRS